MKEAQRKQWNDNKLAELYPTFRDKICEVLIELESNGIRPRIHEAWRSEADQLKALESGHSQLKFGFHNVTGANGTKEALAVDLVDDDLVNNLPTDHGNAEFLLRLFAAAQKQGLMTGIFFGLDKEFPAAMEAIHNAVLNGDWKIDLKHFGWDPTHIQPQDLTLEEARSGKRPA